MNNSEKGMKSMKSVCERMKCVLEGCEKDAEYLYFGKHLCEGHFEELKKLKRKEGEVNDRRK